MARGGNRPGAGRKRNSPNKASIARQAKVAATGVTPLEVIIADMRFHHEAAQRERRKGAKADKGKIASELAAAREAAKDAAPYVHPRLQAVQHTGANGGPIETKDVSDSRESLERKLARIAAASGETCVSGKPH